MRIRVMSDLHLECLADPHDAGIRDDIACDAVVLAGDIHNGVRGIEWAAEAFRKPVVYVMGNHEYYGWDAEELLPLARRRAAALGIHLLEKDAVTIGGTRFLGTTLWTRFDSGPDLGRYLLANAHRRLNDFRQIKYRGRHPLMPRDMAEWFTQSAAWLQRSINSAGPAVVVTHFVPTWRTVKPAYGSGDSLTPYFHSDLEHLMGAAAPVWIYGHNHYSVTETIETASGTTLVCSNQLGYPGETVGFMVDYVLTI